MVEMLKKYILGHTMRLLWLRQDSLFIERKYLLALVNGKSIFHG